MTEIVYEGTWEEIIQRAPDLATRRIRVTVLAEGPAKAAGAQEVSEEGQSLAEAFAGLVGTLSFEPTDLSERTGEAFADLMAEKYREGRL